MPRSPRAHASQLQGPVAAKAAQLARFLGSGYFSIMEQLRTGLQEPAILRLYDYWDARRGARFAPRRQDIDPIHFPYALGDVALAEVLGGSPLAFRYRLVGEN